MKDVQEAVALVLQKNEQDMQSTLEKYYGEIRTFRTGRANPQLLENIRVEYYGSELPLKQLANISAPEARSLEIRPWDIRALAAIEKAIQKSDLDIPPSNDGKLIRLNFPQMTEDRRKDLAKLLRKLTEDFRVQLRNHRRDAIEKVRKGQKVQEIPEDERERLEKIIQKATDGYIQKIDEALAAKEKEILTV